MIISRVKLLRFTVITLTFLFGYLVGKKFHGIISLDENKNDMRILKKLNQQSLSLNNSKYKFKVHQQCVLDVKTLRSNLAIGESGDSLKYSEALPWAADIVEGEWSPPNCISGQKIAIIVPHRDRQNHLKVFINHIHPFLQNQMLSYGIFVMEQGVGRKFNKASLLNIGFTEALKRNYTCFIFHDVDMLPIDERNIYECRQTPFHLSVAINKFHFRLTYDYLVGGAMAMTSEQFTKINGYSNLYFGWGAEDDDLAARLDAVGYKISRNPPTIARYIMISHHGDKGNPANMSREKLFIYARTRFREDGLNSLKYTAISNHSESKLFRKITVQFCKCEVLEKWKKIYNLPDDK